MTSEAMPLQYRLRVFLEDISADYHGWQKEHKKDKPKQNHGELH
ncbi:MAG: hypothetical protein ABGZ19_14855 [Verrucomicrobiales bacterium]